MIFVDGLPLPLSIASSPRRYRCRSLPLSHHPLGYRTLKSLLEHPSLVSASDRLKAMPERKLSSVSEDSTAERSVPPFKHVYVFQREYATVDPGLVELAGTDEATTCVGFVIRNRDSGMISIAHLDSARVVDLGLDQMLSSLVHGEVGVLDVHLIGGFQDAPYSRSEQFHIKTLCVLGHNTKRDSHGNSFPIISGFLVDTSSGSVMPASFDRSSRCPDEIVRRVRVTVSSGDPRWKGKLMDTYDTSCDRFLIAPCSWSLGWAPFASELLQLPDSEILSQCSTSPLAESPDFVDNERRVFNYLIENPGWRLTFYKGRPRIFERAPSVGWTRRS
ncbi:unnamed protein product [Spirodela intermedia]|uniref:Uncharacterized protein n=1 Tax=Spirodela intermedia TaxID=51605 RepID=A0A7I8IUD1_SPIIN|nr:unnamed protein product [Spirodela intermedia]CAA6661606.1 unnamed protein product [Spirodela intermedia]